MGKDELLRIWFAVFQTPQEEADYVEEFSCWDDCWTAFERLYTDKVPY